MVKDLRRGALLDNHAAVHENNAVGNVARELHLMRDHDHGHTALGKVAHNSKDVAYQLGVQRTRGLVKQHHVRVHGQSAGDGNALLLTARKLAWHEVHAVTQTDLLQLLDSDLLGLLFGTLEHLLLGDHDVLLDRKMREQVELLEHHAQLGAHAVDIHALGRDVGAFEDNLTARGLLEQVDAAQHGRLSGTGRAKHDHNLAAVHVDVDTAQNLQVVVALMQALNANDHVILSRDALLDLVVLTHR